MPLNPDALKIPLGDMPVPLQVPPVVPVIRLVKSILPALLHNKLLGLDQVGLGTTPLGSMDIINELKSGWAAKYSTEVP